MSMKLSIREVLTESWGLYKDKFDKLAVFAVLAFLYALFGAFSSYYLAVFGNTNQYMALMLISMVITIVIGPKFIMAIYIYINDIFNGEPAGFINALNRTKGKYWRFVGYTLLLSLIFIPFSVTLGILSDLPGTNILLLFLFALFGASFYLVYPMIALDNNGKQFISRSAGLIKGNYMVILCLVLLTSSIVTLPYNVLLTVGDFSPLELLIIASGVALINFFVSTFGYVVCVSVYRRLAKN